MTMNEHDTQKMLEERKIEILAGPVDRAGLESKYGEVWNTRELEATFTVHGFWAPYVHVTRRADLVEGTLEFLPNPRLYFNFVEK